jgi:hypothetical protein
MDFTQRVGEGDDAGHCSNGLTAQRFRDATREEQATSRRWLGGIAVFYCVVLLLLGAVTFVNSNASRTQISNLPAEASSRAD